MSDRPMSGPKQQVVERITEGAAAAATGTGVLTFLGLRLSDVDMIISIVGGLLSIAVLTVSLVYYARKLRNQDR